MDKKQGVVLFVLFAVYLIIGGAIFMTVENFNEEVVQNQAIPELEKFKEFILNNDTLVSVDNLEVELLKNYLVTVYDNYTTNFLPNGTARVWSFYDAFFFCLTVVTTIGYGNISPSTGMGRVFCVFYALIGIPLTGILMAGIGDYFSVKLLQAHEKTKSARSDSPRLSLVINTVTYLIPGLLLFLFLPAGIFMALEDWTYLDGFYYGFISLTTIGFGDIVAGTNPSEYQWLYKICLTIWITFGLGYLSMILNFMAKAMKSKHVKKLEASFTKISKQTQEALNKEIDVFKQAMNEFIANKMKSKSSNGSLYRTSSLPSLHRQMNGGVRRTTSSGSMSGSREEQTETSVNFIFNLAMALASSADQTGNEDEEGGSGTAHPPPNAQQRQGSIAHLLSMALMPGGMSAGGPSTSGNSAGTSDSVAGSKKRGSRSSNSSAFTEMFANAMRMGSEGKAASKQRKPRTSSRASQQRATAALFESFLFPQMGGVGTGTGVTSGGDGGKLDIEPPQRRSSDFGIYDRNWKLSANLSALEVTAKAAASASASQRKPTAPAGGERDTGHRRVERSVSQPVVKNDIDMVKQRYHGNGHANSAAINQNKVTANHVNNNNGSEYIDVDESISNDIRNMVDEANNYLRSNDPGHTVIPIDSDNSNADVGGRHLGVGGRHLPEVTSAIYRPDCETTTPVIPEEKSDCDSLVSGSCGDEGDALMVASGSRSSVKVVNSDNAPSATVVDMEVDSSGDEDCAATVTTTDDDGRSYSSATSGDHPASGTSTDGSSEFLNERLRSPYVRSASSFITKM